MSNCCSKSITPFFLVTEPPTPGELNETDNRQMHHTNTKLVRALASLGGDSRPVDVNRGNIILLRGAKTSDGGHILLRTESHPKTANLVVDEGEQQAKLGQIFIQHQQQQSGDLAEGVVLQSVKRLGGGAPIFLLSSNDNGNGGGHFLIQTTSAEDVVEEERVGCDNILLQALEGLQDTETSNCSSGRGISTPIGSGKEFFFGSVIVALY